MRTAWRRSCGTTAKWKAPSAWPGRSSLARRTQRITTTQQLIEALKPVTPRQGGNSFLAQVFQALRIAVNDELGSLEALLKQSAQVIKPGGRLVVMSYHSLEDRMVKNWMRGGDFSGEENKDIYGNRIRPFEPDSNKATQPSDKETAMNPRARSARIENSHKDVNKVREKQPEAAPEKREAKAASSPMRLPNAPSSACSTAASSPRRRCWSNMPFILFCAGLMLCYIGYGYWTERTVRDLDRTSSELKEMKSEYLTVRSHLEQAQQQSHVATDIRALGLKESKTPPMRITLNEDQLETTQHP